MKQRVLAFLKSPGAKAFALMALGEAISYAAGPNLGWNRGLTNVANNFTGPTALGLATLGGAGACYGMVFHGEVEGIVRKGAQVAVGAGAAMTVPTLISTIATATALV